MALLPASTPASGPQVTMAALADKMSRGTRFTTTDQSLVVANAAHIMQSTFGPMPENMPLPEITLPESARGILANFHL